MTDLVEALERLFAHPANRAGREAEELVRRIFRRSYFAVTSDPGAAHPRQSDLFVSADRQHYLVEVKATRRKPGVPEVAGVRDRLRRCPPDVIGVLISLSGFAQTAALEIAEHRTQPILLLGGAELMAVAEGSADMRRLLEHKLELLRVDGRVDLQAEEPSTSPSTLLLRQRPAQFLTPDGRPMSWISGSGSFGNYTFVRSITDPTWGPGPRTSAVLNLSPRPRSQDELVRLLDELDELGWLSHDGHWCIQQSVTNWHGVGATSLRAALESWRERYAGVPELHYREEVCYADSLQLGFYTLTFDVSADARREIWYTDFSLELVGIPLDQQPLRELSRTLGDTDPLYLKFRPEPGLERITLRQLELRALPALAYVVVDDDRLERRYVTGIAVANPLQKDRGEEIPYELRTPLRESELLICDLRNWHLFDDRLTGYRLTSLEWVQSSGGLVLRVRADWDDEDFERRLDERHAKPRATRPLDLGFES